MLAELEKARQLRTRILGGDLVIGTQLTITDSSVVEIFARAGYDYLCLDMEHAAITHEIARSMLQAATGTAAVAIVRPLRLDPDEIRRVLDLGSPGVLCPFIQTGEEAERLVRSTRYPPAGTRSWNPRRSGGFGMDAEEYYATANDSMLCIPVIESARAVENIDDIVAVEGIDGVSMGPQDLSMDMGCFRRYDDANFVAAYDKVKKACAASGKAFGTGCYSLEHAVACRDMGATLLLVGGDERALVDGARRYLTALR